MARVLWTLGAASDLETITRFLSRSSNSNVSAFVERVLTAVAGLEAQPRIGRMVPEYEMDRLRELIVHDYRVIYSLDELHESVWIHAIQHGRRDLRRRLGNYPEPGV